MAYPRSPTVFSKHIVYWTYNLNHKEAVEENYGNLTAQQVGWSIDKFYGPLQKGCLEPQVCILLSFERLVNSALLVIDKRGHHQPSAAINRIRVSDREKHWIAYQERKIPTSPPQETAYHFSGVGVPRVGAFILRLTMLPREFRRAMCSGSPR